MVQRRLDCKKKKTWKELYLDGSLLGYRYELLKKYPGAPATIIGEEIHSCRVHCLTTPSRAKPSQKGEERGMSMDVAG